MDKRELSRREVLSSIGLTVGIGLLAGCNEQTHSLPQLETTASAEQPERIPSRKEGVPTRDWQYVKLNPATVATEAYRFVPQGGCMYGLFASIVTAMARLQGEPYRSFPLYMMKYGEGGVGLWGSLCGTVNGGAAIIGLFEPDKQRRENLIAELFSWYERTELPKYHPAQAKDSEEVPKSIAGSVLCHVSVGKWCKASGDEMGSPEMKERCRRLTADVTAKTVELLNAHIQRPSEFAALSPEVKSCLSCHGKELRDTLGKMQCNSCHQQLSKKHPPLPPLPSTSSDNPRKAKP